MSKLSYLNSVYFELWLRNLPRVFSLPSSCLSTMFNFSNKTEEVLFRFPHLGEAIIKKLSNADDSKLREVSRSWQKIVDTPRIFDWRMSIRGRFMMILFKSCFKAAHRFWHVEFWISTWVFPLFLHAENNDKYSIFKIQHIPAWFCLKFIYSEKATKFCEISTKELTVTT